MFDDNFDIQRQFEHFEYDMNHKKRKQRNVITLSGQFATFIVEIVMSASCHLDRVLTVEIGVECQIFVIVIILTAAAFYNFGHTRGIIRVH